MFGRRHEAAFYWIIVQVFQLLEHDRVAHNGLWMASFLPDLMPPLGFGGRSFIAQLT
jgi:hypothetical protein